MAFVRGNSSTGSNDNGIMLQPGVFDRASAYSIRNGYRIML